jgi:hypothetical protein
MFLFSSSDVITCLLQDGYMIPAQDQLEALEIDKDGEYSIPVRLYKTIECTIQDVNRYLSLRHRKWSSLMKVTNHQKI